MNDASSKRARVAIVGLSLGLALVVTATILTKLLSVPPSNASTAAEASSADGTEPRAGKSSAARRGLLVLPAQLFPRGVAQQYEFSEVASVETFVAQPISTLAIAGTLELVGLSAEPPLLVRASFVGSVVATASGELVPDDGTLARSATEPFVLEFAPDGSFVQVLSGSALVPALGRAWTALGESLQLRGAHGKERWEAHENDAVGSYRADYAQAGANTVRKSKRAYEELRSPAVESYDVVRSSARFVLDDDLRLRAYDLSEQTRVSLERLTGFVGTSELKLVRRATRDHVEQLAGWLAEADEASPLTAVARKRDDAALDRARIGGMSDAEAFGLLERGLTGDVATPEQRKKAERAYVALTAMIRQDPAVLAKVRARLEQNGPDSTVMLGALRDASTPAAQRLLAEMTVAGSALDTAGRLEAARCLSHVATPNAETVATLKRLRADREVGIQASYGLGSVLYKLKEGDPKLRDTARSALVEQLAKAGTAGERVVPLTALGNAGDATTLNTIRPYLTDASADVRAAAAQALRRIPGEQTDALLASACADPAAPVPTSALDAIRERPASRVLADALVPLSLHASDFRVRAAATNQLARFVWDLPDLRGTLEHIAESDAHADLRNTARSALALLDREQTKRPGASTAR